MKNHTTSTKWKYQLAASNPNKCIEEKWYNSCRTRETDKKKVPIKTCNPWKPVAKKKVEPAFPSDILSQVEWYSYPCQTVKINARKIVACKLEMLCLYLLHIKQWWHNVTVAPEDNKRMVLNKGIPQVLINSIQLAGKKHPHSTGGERLLWKNAQKIAKKNITSERMNKPKPIFMR